MAAPRCFTSKRTIKSIVSQYRKGASLAFLADEHEVAITTIRNYLMREGVALRSRGRRKKS